MVIGIIFALFLGRLVQLQLLEGAKYSRISGDNAAKTFLETAPRGIIYDRYGKVLVENQPIFYVQVLPHILAAKSESARERILNELSRLLGEKIELKVSANEPIIIKDNIPLETALKIEEKKQELEGTVVSTRAIRLYPYAANLSHVLGYLGEIEARELEKLKEEGYRLGDILGKDGIEKKYDREIRGVDGGKKIEVDVYGTPKRILEDVESVPGADVKLTIDLEMQEAVEKALGGRAGAALVMDARSGEILALASHPNYDPNIFLEPLEEETWRRLERTGNPFMNRGLALYPPGSIFKVVTLAAALEEGLAKPDEMINCPGYYQINNRIARCWLTSGHGSISIIEGLVWSCDVVFYELGKRLGPDLLAKYAHKFGLGERTGIDLPQEKKGTIPTRDWKKNYLNEAWYEGDSINYGIGQGFVTVTPLQMAVMYAAIANGQVLKPFVVKEIIDRNDKIIYKNNYQSAGEMPISLPSLLLMRKALREVVRRGTGVVASVPGLPAAGKTGTAENPGKAHAWFVCFAPYDNPEIVIVAFVEHGEHGDRVTAAITRDILTWYKENRLQKSYAEEKPEGQYILHGKYKTPYYVKKKTEETAGESTE